MSLTPDDLAAMGGKHLKARDLATGIDACAYDGHLWPCDSRRLLDEVEALRDPNAEVVAAALNELTPRGAAIYEAGVKQGREEVKQRTAQRTIHPTTERGARMRRATIAVALVVGLGSLNALSSEAATKVRDPSAQCRYKRAGGWSDADVKATIRCAEHRWSVPGGSRKAISVARCESGFNEHSRYVGHLGVYQHVARYWPARFRHWRVRRWHMHPSALNARSNVVISMRMVHTGGWGPWSCA